MTTQEKLFIFDIGGVLVSLDRVARDRAVRKNSDPGSSLRYRDVPQNIIREFCVGLSTEPQYVEAMAAALGVPVSSVYEAEHAYLGEGDRTFIDFVRLIGKRHRVICLSNNQPIHWRRINDSLLGPDFFNRSYLSQDLGLEKPDPRIFAEVSRAENCGAKHAIFVDDVVENVIAARKAGWQTCIVHRSPLETIRALETIVAGDTPL